MKKREPFAAVTFEGFVSDDGTIRIPQSIVDGGGGMRGGRVVVRLSEPTMAGLLRLRGVSDEEVDLICELQMEKREPVARCLLSEGAWRRGKRMSLRERPKKRLGRP